MATEYGFVYCVGSPVMPNIYKVGMTMSAPRERCDQLSSGTAIPAPFEIMFYIETCGPRGVEAAIHKALDAFRVSDNREFFACGIMDVHGLFKQFNDDNCPMAMTRQGSYAIEIAESNSAAVVITQESLGLFQPSVKPLGFVGDEAEEGW